jgi:hypothetical protein
MATSAQIMQALKAADAAGNTKDAQKLAQMYKAARDAEAAPQTRTAAESLGIGVRNIATGLGGMADIVAAPVNTVANAVAGYQRYSRTPYRDVAERTATTIGLPQRGTSGTDLLAQQIIEGATGAALTAGTGMAVQGARGLIGAVGKALAQQPIATTVAGAAGAGAAEATRQAGGGPIAQTAAGLAAGISPFAATGLANIAKRTVPGARPTVAAATPEIVTAAEAAAPEAGRVFQAGERFGARGSVGAASLEEAAIREQRAAELPIPIELAQFQKSRSFADQQRARELAKNSEVGGPIRDKLAEQQDVLRQNFENFVDGTGSNVWVDPYAKGVILDEALSKLAKTEKTRIRDLYKKAGEAGELREPVPYASVLEFIDGQTPTTRETLAPILSAVKEELLQNDPTGSGVISLGALEDVRKAINQKVQFGTPNASYGGDLKRIIDEATATAGGDVYKQARAARVKYREDFEDIGLVREIIGTKKNSADRVVAYENLVNRIISPGTPFDSLKHVKDLMYRAGPDGEQAWRELQGATYEHLRDQAYKGITRDETGGVVISPAALNTAIRNLESGGKIDLILGKQGAELMRTVNALAQDLFTAPPGAINASGTSSALLNALDKMGMMALSKAPVVGPVVGTIRSALDKELTKLEVQKLIKTDRPAQLTLTQEPPQ